MEVELMNVAFPAWTAVQSKVHMRSRVVKKLAGILVGWADYHSSSKRGRS